MGNLTAAQRVTKVRQAFEPVQKLASKSARNTKMACAYLVELENRLRSQDLYKASVCVRSSAVDSTAGRYSKGMLANHSSLNRKRKLSSGGKDAKSAPAAKKKRTTRCLTCMNVFKAPASVYIGHRTGSSKCPNKGRKILDVDDTEPTKVSKMTLDKYQSALEDLANKYFRPGISWPEYQNNMKWKPVEADLVPCEEDNDYDAKKKLYRDFIRDQRKLHKPPEQNHFLSESDECV